MSEALDQLPEIIDPDSEGRPPTSDNWQREDGFLRQYIDGHKWMVSDVDFDVHESGEEQDAHD